MTQTRAAEVAASLENRMLQDIPRSFNCLALGQNISQFNRDTRLHVESGLKSSYLPETEYGVA